MCVGNFWVASFVLGGLFDKPLCVVFLVASFFLGGLFLRASLHFLGLPLFLSEVFVISPFAFLGLPLFFIGGLCDKPLCVF
jgi:hypothetical protein